MNKVAPSEQPFNEDAQQLMAAYVLGDLDAAEARSFEQLLQKNPQLQRDLTELQQSLEQLYGTEEIMPPASLKGRILSASPQSTVALTAASANGLASEQMPEKASFPMGFSRWALRGLSLAAAGLIAMLGIQNYLLRQSLQALQSAPIERPTESLTFDLAPVEGVQSGKVEVVVDPNQLTAVVTAQDLPPLAADQVYALWTVVAENAPVTADDKDAILTAVFTVDASGDQVKKIAVPAIFQNSQPERLGDGVSLDSSPSPENDAFVKAIAVTVEDAAAPQRHQASPQWIQLL